GQISNPSHSGRIENPSYTTARLAQTQCRVGTTRRNGQARGRRRNLRRVQVGSERCQIGDGGGVNGGVAGDVSDDSRVHQPEGGQANWRGRIALSRRVGRRHV